MTLAMLVTLGGECRAQIRTIPQHVRDSITHPTTVADHPLRFTTEVLDFGTIDEDGGLWNGVIGVKNEGDQPVVITRIVTTCGCVQCDFDRRPLAAGAATELAVRYNPKGHPGRVYQRMFLYTNRSASRPTAILSLSGEVRQVADKALSYPVAHGPLRLRSDVVRLRKSPEGSFEEVRIACRNGGDRAITIVLDSLLSSSGFTLHTEPRKLEAGAEGDLVIEYRAEEVGDRPLLLYWSGWSLAPRERMLRVMIEK